VIIYSAVMPILYLLGVLFCALQHAASKWAVLRLHPTPPAHSYKLVRDTLGWAPWAALCHLCIAFWAYSVTPGFQLTAFSWTAISNATSAVTASALFGHPPYDVFDVSSRLDASLGSLALALAALALLGWLLSRIALCMVEAVLPVASAVRLLGLCLRSLACCTWLRASGEVRSSVEGPPLSLALRGVAHPAVRQLRDGAKTRKVRLDQIAQPRSPCAAAFCALIASPTAWLFRLAGLGRADGRISVEQWNAAKPAHVHFRSASQYAYEPEHSPEYRGFFPDRGTQAATTIAEKLTSRTLRRAGAGLQAVQQQSVACAQQQLVRSQSARRALARSTKDVRCSDEVGSSHAVQQV